MANKIYCVVGVDTRDYSTKPAFRCKAYATREAAEKAMLDRLIEDIDVVAGTYEVNYWNEPEPLLMADFKAKYKDAPGISGRVHWGDWEGGVVEYSIHECEVAD